MSTWIKTIPVSPPKEWCGRKRQANTKIVNLTFLDWIMMPVMLVFGDVMFVLGRRGTATARLAEESSEGKKIDEIEHNAGLEK